VRERERDKKTETSNVNEKKSLIKRVFFIDLGFFQWISTCVMCVYRSDEDKRREKGKKTSTSIIMMIICCSFTNETTFFCYFSFFSFFHHLPESEMKRKTQSSLDLSIVYILEWIMHIPQNELASSTNCDYYNNETSKPSNFFLFSFFFCVEVTKCLVFFRKMKFIFWV
jgi:hypothetical protein